MAFPTTSLFLVYNYRLYGLQKTYCVQGIVFFMISTGSDFQVTATSKIYTLPEETFRKYLDTGDKRLFPEVLNQNADPTE
jgi:hypothetical protein